MSLTDAAAVLDALDDGQIPALDQAVRGLQALNPLIRPGCEPALRDAAATLEVLVATGATIGLSLSAQPHAKAMADAVRRVIV